MIIKLLQNNLKKICLDLHTTLERGGIAIIPFDTVYGLICDPKNEKAIEKIFNLKNRPAKTIGIALAELGQAQDLVEIRHQDFINGKIPGAYTFVLPAPNKMLNNNCYRENTLAIRIPDSILVYSFCQSFGPIAQTSANKSGQKNCYSIQELKAQFGNELDLVDLIVDGGELKNKIISQIWDLTDPTPVKIERK
jgi:tRNA threonylcarbamoyl adenosine modification protein (Sua5/YciO/YrdC/YwlC family)